MSVEIEPPIVCMGVPGDYECPDPAVQIIHLHAQVAGVFCAKHTHVRVQEIIDMGHGSCRTGPLETCGFSTTAIREFADKYRGKLAMIPPGRHYKKKMGRSRR